MWSPEGEVLLQPQQRAIVLFEYGITGPTFGFINVRLSQLSQLILCACVHCPPASTIQQQASGQSRLLCSTNADQAAVSKPVAASASWPPRCQATVEAALEHPRVVQHCQLRAGHLPLDRLLLVDVQHHHLRHTAWWSATAAI